MCYYYIIDFCEQSIFKWVCYPLPKRWKPNIFPTFPPKNEWKHTAKKYENICSHILLLKEVNFNTLCVCVVSKLLSVS